MLTTGRLVVSPFVALAYLVLPLSQASALAAAIFAAASVTDFLDGHLARRYNLVSNFGKMLDPIADKTLVVIALLAIIANSGMNPWLIVPSVAIVFRELFISGLREHMSRSGADLGSTGMGKTKAAFQMAAIFLLLAAPAIPKLSEIVGLAGLALLWVAALLSVVSAVNYFRKALPHL